jgi:transposase
MVKLEAGLSAQRIYQDLFSEHGYSGTYYSVRRYVAGLAASPGTAVRRIEVEAGHEMQVDYGMGARCMDHTGTLRKTHLFRLVLSHSRKGYTEAVTRLTTESFIRSLENAFRILGGVPKVVVFDNAKAVVKQADWYDPELNPKIIAFCKHYGFALIPTRPRTPEHKGKVERGVDYVQENAIKGMTFESLALQNQHLIQWEKNVADTRIHGTTKMHVGPLPSEPFPIYDEGVRKVARDGHVEVKGAYYSAPPEYLGCEIWMRWNDRVVRMMNHRQEQIAIHPRMEKGKFSTLSEHISPKKINGIERGAQYLMTKAKLIGPHSARWAEGALSEHGIQGMRIIQGLLSLTRKYESSEIEKATDTAWRSGSFRCRTLRKLLEHGGAKQQTMEFMEEHPVIRPILEYSQFFQRALAGG